MPLKNQISTLAVFLLIFVGCTQKSNILGALGSSGNTSASTGSPTPPSGTPPASTPLPPPPPPPVSGGAIKWNPGHYLASEGTVGLGTTIANSQNLPYELAALNNQDAFVGYRIFVTWAALEPTEGNYDFSIITSANGTGVLDYLKTKLNVRKHLVLVVLPGSFTSTTASKSTIPQYILSDSTYGPSPVSGSYGWWGGAGNGNTSSACLYRPAVAARWNALQQALGSAFDSEPYFEAVMFQEDSWVEGAWGSNHAPDYPGGSGPKGTLQMYETTLTVTAKAFPHTNIIEENTWCCGTPDPTNQLEKFMIKNRIAPGTADTYGQTWIDAHNGELQNWGLDFYIGLIASFNSSNQQIFTPGTDYRSQMPSMLDIEGPDLGVYQNMGGPIGAGGWTPQDICNALNKSYNTSHAFWTYLGNGSNIPPTAQWNNLAAAVTKCPLINIKYPAVYP